MARLECILPSPVEECGGTKSWQWCHLLNDGVRLTKTSFSYFSSSRWGTKRSWLCSMTFTFDKISSSCGRWRYRWVDGHRGTPDSKLLPFRVGNKIIVCLRPEFLPQSIRCNRWVFLSNELLIAVWFWARILLLSIDQLCIDIKYLNILRQWVLSWLSWLLRSAVNQRNLYVATLRMRTSGQAGTWCRKCWHVCDFSTKLAKYDFTKLINSLSYIDITIITLSFINRWVLCLSCY